MAKPAPIKIVSKLIYLLTNFKNKLNIQNGRCER